MSCPLKHFSSVHSAHPPHNLPLLQTSWGVLLPIALLWAWEERLRARELKLWRQQPVVQEVSAATARQPQLQAQCSQDLPLPFPIMAAWVVGTAWLLWLLLEVTILF